MTLRRHTPMKPSIGTRWPPRVRRAIVDRDEGCVGPRVGFLGDCWGGLELDHVRASGAVSKKSASTVANGVVLCSVHHAWKTVHGREARPVLLDWIATHPTPEPEEGCGHVDPVFGCPDCESRRRVVA